MATLSYRGRSPDSDATIAPKGYADTYSASVAVTTTVVNSIISTAAATLTTKAYVDTRDALYAKKTAVTTADGNYLPTPYLSVAVAGLDGNATLLSSQIPTGVVTDRVFKCYSLNQAVASAVGPSTSTTVANASGTVNLTSGQSHTVTTTTLREYRLATISIPDPGYLWRPLPFAWVQGNSSGGSVPATPDLGNGNYGLLTCTPPSGVSDTIYGTAICTGKPTTDTYVVTPFALPSQTPTSVPAITGALQLDLYGCCFSGTTYTFIGTNLQYFVLVVPAL